MNKLRNTARDWLRRELGAIVISISDSEGSAPRNAGCRMLVSVLGQAGTIGGGNLEWQAVRHARQLLDRATCTVAFEPQQRIALGPSVGQCCGGVVHLRYERLTSATLAQWSDEAELFRLHLFGAGHVAAALVQTLSSLACSVEWYDSRVEYRALAQQQLNSQQVNARLRIHEFDWDSGNNGTANTVFDGDSAADFIGKQDLVLVMSHRHDLDLAICHDVLRHQRGAFLGLIGSRTKSIRFKRRLAQWGLSTASIARLHCPLAPNSGSSKEPAALAIVIAAQLLLVAAPAAPFYHHEPLAVDATA